MSDVKHMNQSGNISRVTVHTCTWTRKFYIYMVCCRNGIGAGCYPVLLKCSTGSNPVHTALLAYRNGYNGTVLKTDVAIALWVRIPPQALERTIFPIFTSYCLYLLFLARNGIIELIGSFRTRLWKSYRLLSAAR